MPQRSSSSSDGSVNSSETEDTDSDHSKSESSNKSSASESASEDEDVDVMESEDESEHSDDDSESQDDEEQNSEVSDFSGTESDISGSSEGDVSEHSDYECDVASDISQDTEPSKGSSKPPSSSALSSSSDNNSIKSSEISELESMVNDNESDDGHGDEVSETSQRTASSGIGESEGSDIFEDAQAYVERMKADKIEYKEVSRTSEKSKIFREPPGLLSMEEYRIAVAKFIANGISWKDTSSTLFQTARHAQIETTVCQMYFAALAEEVEHKMSELITTVCCNRNLKLLDYLKVFKKPDIFSELWEQIIELEENDITYVSSVDLKVKLWNLQKGKKEAGEKKKFEKQCRKIVFNWMHLINSLVPHFFDDSVEREMLSCIFNWFTSGQMSLQQFRSWKTVYENGLTLRNLKKASWKDQKNAKEHVTLFLSLIDDVEGNELMRIEEFKELLEQFLSDPIIKLVDKGTRLQVIGKGLFLSEIVSDVLMKKTSNVKEINIYSKYFFGMDSSMENEQWHGMNVTIVTDKLTIWKTCTIDVSGKSYSRDVRGSAAKGRDCGEDGDDGNDGRAGESSGNVAILTNELKNREKLTVKLNGGSGEGGQNGGAGADGREGIKITKDDFLSTILSYRSLYRDSWSKFANYEPGSGWEETYSKAVNEYYTKWIYKTYSHDDGREMTYSYAGDCGHTYSDFEIFFLITGTDGSMGGSGGQNGVSGEGGNAGDFTARSLKTGEVYEGFRSIKADQGKDGHEGNPGSPGSPGSHGNHMAMNDRTEGGFSWSKRVARRIHGDSEKNRLQIKQEYSKGSSNALNGYRRHELGWSDYYTTFSAESVPSISHTKRTERKTASERQSKSMAVSKQTISIETLLEEFADVCEGDELNIGDLSAFAEFEADEEEEEEEVEQVQEEISIMRTLIEDSLEHEKNLRRAIVKPEEVVEEMKKAAKRGHDITLVEVIDLFKKAFTAPFDVNSLESDINILMSFLSQDSWVESFFVGRHTLSNGMTRRNVASFVDQLKSKLEAKQELSDLKMSLVLDAEEPKDLVTKNDELSDVVTTNLESFWLEVESDNYKSALIQPLFNQIRDNDLFSKDLLLALYKVNEFLKKKKEVFQPFYRESFNWADLAEVEAHLHSFLTEKERKELAQKSEKEKNEAEQNARKEEAKKKKKKAKEEKAKEKAAKSNPSHETSTELAESSNGEEEQKDDELDDEEDEIFAEKSSWFGNLRSMIGGKGISQAFEPVAKKFKDNNATEKVFSGLVDILKNDRRLSQRFCFEKTSIRNTLRPPGTTPQSLIHMYYFTEQILNFNVKLYRYYSAYEGMITVPNEWYDAEKEATLNDVTDLIKWVEGRELPRINSEMHHFMLTNGIRCRAYRQMVADAKQVNVQMFCESGYCKMRLVENLNPEYVEIQRLTIKDGVLRSIGVNEPLRKLRAVMTTVRLSTPKHHSFLPQCTGSLELSNYFPHSFTPKVLEWTEAAIVATGSEMLPRFLQRLFELRGNSMTIVDFQFAINTLIEVNRNFEVPLEQLCSRILSKDGFLLEIFLALRVLGVMKGTAPKLDPLVRQLSDIKDSRIKALFGSKLHEIHITDQVLSSLINMLAHAEDRVAQLEKLELKEWVNIASCQKWNSYAPLLKAYGTVGYYIVLLDTMGKEEGQRLERIIENMKSSKKCIILEKLISMLTFLIANNEVEFNDEYEVALSHFLQIISDQCENMDHDKLLKEGNCTATDNIYLIVNEKLQEEVACEIHKKMMRGNGENGYREAVNLVFPKDDRTLKDLIHLSVNPQDKPEDKEIRRQEMKEIQTILEAKDSKDDYGEKLKIIDDKLYNIFGKRLRDTQKIAILSAAKSKKNLLSQVNTGEGKSFIISCLAILRILVEPEDTVDIITSSSVLAQRDAEAMKQLYEAFNIEVGHNCDEDVEKRKLAYKCGVVYGDIARFERDYLLQTFYKKNILGSRTRCNVIVDEVDSMLLDNGSNMLYLSHNVPGLELLDSLFVYLHKLVATPSITEDDDGYSSESLRKKVLRDMCGLITKEDVRQLLFNENDATAVGKVWRILITQNVINPEGIMNHAWDCASVAEKLKSECGQTLAGRILAMLEIVNNRKQEIGIPTYLKQFVIFHLDDFIKNAKQALFLKHNDEYVVDLDRTGRTSDLHPVITIIDKGTGTDLSTSQWSEGLHQFLQLKHGCRLTPISLKAVFVSNVSYLKDYKRLNGFSGTLGSEEESKSLVELYNADMLKIPTWKPKKFNENAPVLSTTSEAWVRDIFDEICDQVLAKRSVLVICQSIAKVEELHKEFQKLVETTSPHIVKNAFNKVTVYTREFDEVDFATEGELPSSRIIISTNLAGRGTDIALSNELANAGGLHVIVTFLPENSRIENQAYGRAARCGQSGSGQIICLVQEEDNGANNIFQLKQFRDNAEVHRLRSLKQFYDYHIAVEEKALNMFKDHCSVVMEAVHSSSEHLTVMQVIYFALLDEWASWLDSKTEEIKQCEKNKNDVLKDHIIASVRNFLERHPLPQDSLDCLKSLEWIKCPQPLLSIALIHLENGMASDATSILDKVIKNFPDFEAEACYYKGIIEQWEIREVLQHQPQPEKDKEGNMVTGSLGVRLSAVNWLLRNVIDSDDCPDEYVQHCMEKLLNASEYFLLSRSLFATRIRKKQAMTRIVQMLQHNTSDVVSRGFAVQQEESIAVLECFIGSIDDIMGHRAKFEDVKLGTEEPYLTVRRFREIVKKADIVTPPQLANKISDQQLNILSANHCLPVSALQFGFKQIYGNMEMMMYDGQKIITAEELAGTFSLPSIRGFWESLRRAGCFLAEQVYIAVRKTNKGKIPALRDISPTEVTLNALHVQLSTEDLSLYDLYDVHGPAAAIRQSEAKNAELNEAQEAGLVLIEVLAIINPMSLMCCKHLDQFSYLTAEEVAAELSISILEATWIMDMLVAQGVVERKLATIKQPLTPEEIDAQNRNKIIEMEAQEGMKSTETETKKAEMEATHGKEAGNAEEDPGMEMKPEEKIMAYFPVARISCDCFPANMRDVIHMMLTRNFSYYYALNSLKASVLSAVEGKKFIAHQICLPTDPYADLFQDLQNLGVVQHSRVTSVLADVYKRTEDGKVVKWAKDLVGAKTVVHYIDSFVYKQLEPKAPKLCTRKCDLMATSEYLNSKNVPASVEIRKAVSNGLRKVAIIQKKNWWKWMLGIFLKITAVLVPLMLLAAAIFAPIAPYVLLALLVVAAVGTVLYCMSLHSQNQKIASTLNLDEEEEFHMLRTYHDSALDAPKRSKAIETQRKATEKMTADFLQILIAVLDTASRPTSSDEDISLWVGTLEHCANNSVYLPLLQQSIEMWFRSNGRNIQEACFEAIFNGHGPTTSNMDPCLPALPTMPFAFSSMLISEVNRRKKSKGKRSKKAITTKLDFNSFSRPRDFSLTSPTEDSCPLSFALSKTLKNLLTPMIEENIAAVMNPVLGGIDAAWRKSQEDKMQPVQQNASSLKKRQTQHSAERLTKEQAVDFMATDLHNIFQRIAFREISKPMLQHMVHYNYPLSPHCAEMIFDACVTILQSVDSVLKQVDIELKRGDNTIFTYHGLKEGCPKKDRIPMIIGLEKDSFYVLEVAELTKDHRKYHHGLFQALQEYSTKFSDNFGMDPQSFVEKLQQTVALDTSLDRRWISSVSWSGNEKMRCAVAIW